FLVAADHRVELALASVLGEVAGVFLERIVLIFGAGALGGAALAQFGYGLLELLAGEAGLLQNVGRRPRRYRQTEQQALRGDVRISRLGRRLLGRIERALERIRGIHAVIAALDLRQRLHGLVGFIPSLARIGAGGGQQGARQALAIVQKRLQKVLGLE